MDVGLIDIDGGEWPNLALMKLSAYWKRRGAKIELVKTNDVLYGQSLFTPHERIFGAVVFDRNRMIAKRLQECGVEVGGSGWDLENMLPEEVENMYPDYGLYGIRDMVYGFLTRGCPRQCPFCIVSKKEGTISKQVADLEQIWSGQHHIKLLDPNLLACTEHEKLLAQLIESGARVDFTQGVDARLLNPDNVKLLGRVKTQRIHFAWDSVADELTPRMLWHFKKYTRLPSWKLRCYVLTNYNSTLEEDLYRIYRLREMDIYPYVMIYAKDTAPKKVRYLQRWVNNPIIWRTVSRFEEYDHRIG